MKKKTTIQSYELLSFANRKSKIVDVLIFYINLTQRRALRSTQSIKYLLQKIANNVS